MWSRGLPDHTWRHQVCRIAIAIGSRLHRTLIHRTVVIFIAIFSPIGRLAVDPPHDRGALDRGIAIVHPAEASLDGVEDSWKDTTIAVRSNRDRGAIKPRSWIFHRGIDSAIFRRRSMVDRDHDQPTIVARSRRDRGPIVVRSWLLLRLIWERIHREFGSYEAAQRNRSHNLSKPLPRPLQLPTIFGLIFPLKTHVFSLCTSTFDRFVKKLSEFRGRSLVHRDPPGFILDCKAIGEGLITNFSLISSNFPLEFRTSTRKNPSKFASINENWIPILTANRVISEIRSINRR